MYVRMYVSPRLNHKIDLLKHFFLNSLVQDLHTSILVYAMILKFDGLLQNARPRIRRGLLQQIQIQTRAPSTILVDTTLPQREVTRLTAQLSY
jgi:hypothetical protein